MRDGEKDWAFVPEFPASFAWVIPRACGMSSNPEGLPPARDCAVLLYVLEGEGDAGPEEACVPYAPDCVIHVEQGARPMLRPRKTTSVLYLQLQNAAPLLGSVGAVRSMPHGGVAGRRFSGLCRQLREGALDDAYAASVLVYALLMALQASHARGHAPYSPLVRDAVDHILRNYAFLTGVDELAEQVGVAKSHLIRRFTAETGQGPGKYLQQVRLEQARLLLRNREYSIDLVASMVGYSGSNYFCKVFRRTVGESPGSYRARAARAAPDLEARRRLQELENLAQL